MSLPSKYNNFVTACRFELLLKSAAHFLQLYIRYLIAKIYFFSGLTKISNLDQTFFLFQYEYRVPLLPTEVAAYLSIGIELVCPILIMLGIFTRLASLPLFFMTLIIQFFIIPNPEHYYWLALIMTLIIYGSKSLSIDFFLSKKFKSLNV